MSQPFWLSKAMILAIHGRLLAEHGGPSGLRDEGLLDSALAAPVNHFEYDQADVHMLAASYAYSLTRNHPFIDGNKRTAFVAAGVFLELNGNRLTASEPDAVLAVMGLASGEIGVEEFCGWLRDSSVEKGEEAD